MNPLYQPILEMPGIDIHSHIRGEHSQAYDLSEVFFYHVAAQAMVAAGMPHELLHHKRPLDERIREALPYFGKIRNTTMYRLICQTLRKLHDFDAEDLTWDHWEPLCRRFEATSAQPGWTQEVLCDKAKLALSVTSTPQGRDAIAPDQRSFMTYTCEQAITSADILPLLEQHGGAPLVTTAALNEAIETHLDDRLAAGAGSFTYWPPRGFVCPPETAPNVDSLLATRARGEALTSEQLRALDEAVAYRSLPVLNEKGLPLVMCLGITIGDHHRTLLRYDPEESGEVLRMALRYPKIDFFLMVGNVTQSQELCTVAKQVPNAHLACSWWHGMYPAYAERELEERLEMVPYTQLVAIITDAWCAEWSIARSLLGREVLANVLWRKVESGEYRADFALEIAQAMVYDNPARAFAR